MPASSTSAQLGSEERRRSLEHRSAPTHKQTRNEQNRHSLGHRPLEQEKSIDNKKRHGSFLKKIRAPKPFETVDDTLEELQARLHVSASGAARIDNVFVLG